MRRCYGLNVSVLQNSYVEARALPRVMAFGREAFAGDQDGSHESSVLTTRSGPR